MHNKTPISGTRGFTADKVSDAKRLVRGDLYLHTAHSLQSLLFLPGRCPVAEITAARFLNPSLELTAVDSDAGAIRKVRNLDCVEAMHSDVGARRIRYRNEQLRRYDGVFLDYCAPIGLETARTTDLVARQASKLCAVFVSYGRQETILDINSRDARLPPIIRERVDSITSNILGRSGLGGGERPGKVVRVYRYPGAGGLTRMLGVVVDFDPSAPEWEPFYFDAYSRYLSPAVSVTVRALGSLGASCVYDVSLARLGEWGL